MRIDALKSNFMDLTADPVAVGYLAPGEQSACLVYVNKAFTDQFGYAPEDILGRTLDSIHGRNTRFPHGNGKGSDCREGDRNHTAEVQIKHANGTKIWTSISFSFVEDENDEGFYVCATYRNIANLKETITDLEDTLSSRERAHSDLVHDLRTAEHSHERIVSALNAYPDPIVIYDCELNLVYWNDGYAASVTDNSDDLIEGMHLKDVLQTAIRYGRYPNAVGRETEWVNEILSPGTLQSKWQDVELEGDIHHRLMRSRSANGDYVVIRLNSTELVRQKRTAEAAQARLIAALNAYPAPFVIYDFDDRLVVCNDAYRDSMTSNPDDIQAGMHRTEVARIAIRAGKIRNAVGREEEWMSDAHQTVDVSKPVQDLELPGDVHHRLLRSRVENGDLVILRIDTTELVRQRRALEESQDRLISAINAYPDPFAIYDADLNLVIWNPAYADSVTDRPDDLKPGTNLKELLRNAAKAGRVPAAIGREDEWVEEYYSPDLLAPGVEDFEFADDQHHRMVRSRTEKGEYVVLRIDTTELVRQRRAVEQYSKKLETANQEITYKALHDDLTGLGNRRFLAMKFEELVKRRNETGGEIASLNIDLDRFKHINDTMGHAAGDEVLLDISMRIRDNAAPEDVVARIGGDEFVVLLHVSADSARPEQLAQRLLEELSRPMRFEGKLCRFGASIGLARTPLAQIDELLTNSDVALYKAKRRGRGQLGIFDRSDLEELHRTKTIADDVLRGIEKGEFEPYYQPQVDAASGEIVGIEALARWRHPDKGVLPPADFLSVATDLNVAAEIDKMIFERAIAECQQAFGATTRPLSLSFNVSENRITDSEIDAIRQHVSAYSGQVSFELLETTFLEEQDDDFFLQLNRLRKLGVAIEVDDFGSGRASVVALQRINPDRLKIDRRLVSLVAEGSGGLRLLRSIIEIGQALEIGVTAEGVEKRAQAEILTSLGCDRLQGFYFAKPMSHPDLLKYIDAPSVSVMGA